MISDRFGRKAVVIPCLALLSLGHILLPFTHAASTLFLCALLLGFGNSLGSGIVMTLGADRAPTSAGRRSSPYGGSSATAARRRGRCLSEQSSPSRLSPHQGGSSAPWASRLSSWSCATWTIRHVRGPGGPQETEPPAGRAPAGLQVVRSTANWRRSSSPHHSRLETCVAARTTGGA